jgi:hypothetical protein
MSVYAAEMQVRNNVKMLCSRVQTLLHFRRRQKLDMEIVRQPSKIAPIRRRFLLTLHCNPSLLLSTSSSNPSPYRVSLKMSKFLSLCYSYSTRQLETNQEQTHDSSRKSRRKLRQCPGRKPPLINLFDLAASKFLPVALKHAFSRRATDPKSVVKYQHASFDKLSGIARFLCIPNDQGSTMAPNPLTPKVGGRPVLYHLLIVALDSNFPLSLRYSRLDRIDHGARFHFHYSVFFFFLGVGVKLVFLFSLQVFANDTLLYQSSLLYLVIVRSVTFFYNASAKQLNTKASKCLAPTVAIFSILFFHSLFVIVVFCSPLYPPTVQV